MLDKPGLRPVNFGTNYLFITIIIITIVLCSAPSRLPTQKRSQPSLGQT